MAGALAGSIEAGNWSASLVESGTSSGSACLATLSERSPQVFLDWSHAIAHNACYSIHPSQNFTDFPSNINDSDLRDGQPVIPRPTEEYTQVSFSICKFRFVSLYRELVDVSSSQACNSEQH